MVVINEQFFEQLNTKLDSIVSILKNQPSEQSDDWLQKQQVMKLLGVCSKTLQTYRDAGKIGFSKVGRKIVFAKSDVAEFLKRHYHEPYLNRSIMKDKSKNSYCQKKFK